MSEYPISNDSISWVTISKESFERALEDACKRVETRPLLPDTVDEAIIDKMALSQKNANSFSNLYGGTE